jgi:hypothetical protein
MLALYVPVKFYKQLKCIIYTFSSKLDSLTSPDTTAKYLWTKLCVITIARVEHQLSKL